MNYTYNDAMERALKYLHLRPKTEKEIRAYLREKGHDDEIITAVSEKLTTLGYAGDKLFTKMYLESEVIKKGKPLISIQAKLLRRGIDKRLFQELAQELGSEVQEGTFSRIEKEIQKYKSRGVEGMDIIQKLLRKGYHLNDIKKIIKMRSED